MALYPHLGTGKSTWLAGLAFAAALGTAPVAGATILNIGLTTEFSGGTTPGGTPPFITATFDDSVGGPNDVRITMSAANLVGSENVELWLFNFNPAKDPTQLTFTSVGTPGSVATISTGTNAFMADGDGKYDISFDFPPPPGNAAALFTSGETVVFDITYTGPIDVSDFNFFSVESAGNGVFQSAAHVLRVGPQANKSGWIGAVPEPSTALLFGAGLLGLASLRRRR